MCFLYHESVDVFVVGERDLPSVHSGAIRAFTHAHESNDAIRDAFRQPVRLILTGKHTEGIKIHAHGLRRVRSVDQDVGSEPLSSCLLLVSEFATNGIFTPAGQNEQFEASSNH